MYLLKNTYFILFRPKDEFNHAHTAQGNLIKFLTYHLPYIRNTIR